jgi:hypothetical protein
MKNDSMIFIQINELNFDIVEEYIKNENLPNFEKLLSNFKRLETFSEKEYENLEPWIQWVSFNTGLTFSEHKIHKLGDIVHSPKGLLQIYEKLEKCGYKIGAVSPMNTRNALENPSYFIPDPWTDTKTDGSPFSIRLSKMLQQTVNDNSASKISIWSFVTLIEAVIRSFKFPETLKLAKYVFLSLRKSWYKPIVLDTLIHLIHMMFLRKKNPDVSFLFLNAGAHIQHHYLFNSPYSKTTLKNPLWYVSPGSDPLLDLIRSYDVILGNYLDLVENGARLVLATGLTQIPYDRVKYYYRLRQHADFFQKIGIKFSRILPRMTRDFELVFDKVDDIAPALNVLEGLIIEGSGENIFGNITVRDRSIFASLVYSREILNDDVAVFQNKKITNFIQDIVFVALKNGMHSNKGFSFFSKNYEFVMPHNTIHVSELHDLIMRSIEINSPLKKGV